MKREASGQARQAQAPVAGREGTEHEGTEHEGTEHEGTEHEGTAHEGTAPAHFTGSTAVRGVRWSLLAVLSRQGFQMACAIVLARLLGPESYGIISASTIYVTLTALFLDQGFSAALVQNPGVTRSTAGATATLNIFVALVLGVATVFAAPVVAQFFRADGVAALLLPLAVSIPLKALAITPRAMLSRDLLLHHIARADIAGAATGAVAGIGAAVFGAGYFALAYQVLATDVVTAALLLAASRGPAPNIRLREVRPLLAFSLSVFLTDCLAYFSRNVDNILVGRYLGVASLSLYSMAYRIMVVPVQLVGQTVNRIMFPAFSRSADHPSRLAEQLRTSTQLVAMTVVPAMAYVACAAPALVHLVLGDAWLPAAGIISVLAVGGARETVFYITPSLMKGLGKGSLIVRYEVLAAMMQVGGIVVGLQFGLFWVAVGLVAGGFALVPALLTIQSRLTGLRIRSQLGVIWPAVHGALWGSAAYLGIGLAGWPPLATASAGLAAFMLVDVTVLFALHRQNLRLFLGRGWTLLVRQKQRPSAAGLTE